MSEHVRVYADTDLDEVADTLAVLENAGIPYTLVDITHDEAALAHVEELGFTQTPVVDAGTLGWAGFRPDLIDALPTGRPVGPSDVTH